MIEGVNMRNPCFCISLATGAIAIAVFEIVAWSIALGIFSLTLAVLTFAHQKADLKELEKKEEFKNIQETVTGAYTILILCIILSIVRIIVASVLIHGVRKNSLTLVKSWLYVKCLVLIMSAVLYIISFATSQYTVSTALFDTFSLALDVYFIYVVICLCAEMKMASHPKPRLPNSEIPTQTKPQQMSHPPPYTLA